MADEIKSLDDLKDAVGEDIAGVSARKVRSPRPPFHREPVRDELGRSYATGKAQGRGRPRLDPPRIGPRSR